jgi:hypothetical protein
LGAKTVAGVFWLVLGAAAFLGAQERTDPDVVGQDFAWAPVDGALRYELEVADDHGLERQRWSTEVPRWTTHLPPGTYQYRVVVYNLLDEPEVSTPWQGIRVARAEVPEVQTLDPATVYLESPPYRFRVVGRDLQPGATFTLTPLDDPDSGEPPVSVGQEVAREGTTAVVIEVPGQALSFGRYRVTVRNPGGIRRDSPVVLQVKFDRPFDVLISAGYAGVFNLYDDWVTDTYPQKVFPWGAVARVQVDFWKASKVRFGAEAEAVGWLQTGGTDLATLQSRFLQAGVNLSTTVLWDKAFRWLFRLGGGGLLNDNKFSYGSYTGTSWASADIHVTASAGLAWTFAPRWFAEADLQWSHVFNNGYATGTLKPLVLTGYQF